jgi:hypothetical protein
MHPYLLSLCQEYVALIDDMRHGRYAQAELRTLDSQRQVTHNQLIAIVGDQDDMYAYARAVLLAARGSNQQ